MAILDAIVRLQERGCRLFAITSAPDSPIARAAERVLPLPAVEEMCPLNQAPITSTVSTLALCQLVVAATMEQRAFRIERYARNHPGGAIGKRIFVKIDDLMVRGEKLPTVSPEAAFPLSVSRMTEFACAALLVVDDGQLMGLISEKDLRLAMEQHGPSVFDKRASDIMNPSPIGSPAGFSIYSGDDPTAIALMLLGGHGNISVTANVAPRAMADLCRAALAGDARGATEIHLRLLALHRQLFAESNPIPVKWALARLGRCGAHLRLPLVGLSEALQAPLEAALSEAGLL